MVKNSPSLNVVNDRLIPRCYWVHPEIPDMRIDKVALLHDLKIGPVGGAELVQTKRVKIK